MAERTIGASAALTLIVGLVLSTSSAAHAAPADRTATEPSPLVETTVVEETTIPPSDGPDQEDDEGDESDLSSPEPTGDAELEPTEPPETSEPEPTEPESPEPEPTGDPEPDSGEEPLDGEGEDDAIDEDDRTLFPGTPSPTDTPTQAPPSPQPPASPSPTSPPSGSQTTSPAPPSGIRCESRGLYPGATVTVACTAAEGTRLALGSSESAIGGTISHSGLEITYTAPASVEGTPTDPFTVVAVGPDGERTTTQVSFTVYGAANGETGADAPARSTPSPTTHNASPTASANAPAPSAAQFPEGLLSLPIFGLPASIWDKLPAAPSAADTDPSPGSGDGEDAEAEGPEEMLAQTGSAQTAWTGSLALASIILGAAALRTSRRPIR